VVLVLSFSQVRDAIYETYSLSFLVLRHLIMVIIHVYVF
jgi:hypothetical protein